MSKNVCRNWDTMLMATLFLHDKKGKIVMNDIVQIAVTVICSVLASSGLWAFIATRADKKDAKTEMLIGLAHDRILSLGVFYLDRGDWITADEYENLHDYLYVPYEKMGGNGSAKRVMAEVTNKLKIVKVDRRVNDHAEQQDVR